MNELSNVPLKLNMTLPENQEAARSAWGALRAAHGQPGSADDNMNRMSSSLRDRFVGWPTNEIYNQITRDEGLRPGQAAFQMTDDAPDPGHPDRYAATRTTRFADTKAVVPWNGKEPQSLTLMANDTPVSMRQGMASHEAVHAWANGMRPSFQEAPDSGGLNQFGEEPAPHFPGGYHDRQIVEALEAQELASRYGGYPPGFQRQSPWPIAKKQYGTGTPAPKFKPEPAIVGPTDWMPE